MSIYEIHNMTDDIPIIMHPDAFSANKMYTPNWHENIEILYCTKGKGKIIINDCPVSLSEGSIAVINSNRIHYSLVDSNVFQYYCFIIDADFLRKSGLNIENTEFEELITDDAINKCLDNIIYEFDAKKPFYENIVKGNTLALMSYISRKYSYIKNKAPNDSAIKKGIEYIHQHFTEDIAISDISDFAGFSKSHFSRKFKSITGYSIKQYIQWLRCREAQSMLLTHKYTISKVSDACGFSDVSYFTKVFKKQFGKLPSEIKNQHLM